MARILMLCPYPPYPPRSGGALRMYHLLVGLARRHRITCLTFGTELPTAASDHLQPLHDFCTVHVVTDTPQRTLWQRTWTTLASPLPDMALRNASPAYTAALHELVAQHPFDVILAESIEMAHYGLHPIEHNPPPRRILDQFNAEYVLQRRAASIDFENLLHTDSRTPRTLAAVPYSLVQWGKLAHFEQQMMRQYDRVLTVSEEDRNALRQLCPDTPMTIVPNGVDTIYFQPRRRPTPTADAPLDLVFTGTLNFRPNVDGVLWFAREVLPQIHLRQPRARFVVVGRSPVPEIVALHNEQQRIVVAADVPDVRPYMERAAVYVVPLRVGGGIRLKLLEALAMSLPIVSTSLGAEGVPELHHSEQLLLGDTPQTFAAAVLWLLDMPELAEHMGKRGRQLVRSHYDWSVIVPRLEAVL